MRDKATHEAPVIRVLAIALTLLILAGCSQTQKCVRDIVARNEPYQTREDRQDTEAFARELCLQRSGKGG